jgi:hypothetical protein
LGIVFHAPEVFQDRNAHDNMRDFEDEVPGYMRNKEFASLLDSLSLDSRETSVSENLLVCYEALVQANFFPEKELELVQAWLEDLDKLRSEI